MNRGHTKSRRSDRRGAAVVELAFTLPILLIITFGSIEASNVLFLKQGITEAAYEGVRVATTHAATEADARQRAQQILTARGITDGTLTVSPAITSETPPGTTVTFTVTAPSNSNSIGPQWYFKDATMSATVVMVRL